MDLGLLTLRLYTASLSLFGKADTYGVLFISFSRGGQSGAHSVLTSRRSRAAHALSRFIREKVELQNLLYYCGFFAPVARAFLELASLRVCRSQRGIT